MKTIRNKKTGEEITLDEFDRRFDDGQDDVLDFFEEENVVVREVPKRVNVDFPKWMVEALDGRARHLGINRQAVIKTLLADALEHA